MMTAHEKLAAVERELRYRRRVFQRRIDRGSMTFVFAQQQIAIFEEIAEDYRKLAEKEQLL